MSVRLTRAAAAPLERFNGFQLAFLTMAVCLTGLGCFFSVLGGLGTPNMDGLAYGVDFAASPTPEPSSLLLLGTGMTGLFTLLRRKRTA